MGEGRDLRRYGVLAETRRQGSLVALVVGPAGRQRGWSVLVGLDGGERLFHATDLVDQPTAEALAIAQLALLARGRSGRKAQEDHA